MYPDYSLDLVWGSIQRISGFLRNARSQILHQDSRLCSRFQAICMIGRIIVAAFQFCFMALAVDVIDRRGSRNEMCCQL